MLDNSQRNREAPPPAPTAFLFDLDGTLTKYETIPIIADAFGLESLNELTRATVSGDIPFQESFHRRVQILSEIPAGVVAEVVLSVPVHETLMSWIRRNRQKCWVVTGNLDRWVQPWLDHWGLRGFTSLSQLHNGKIRVAPGGLLEKSSVLRHFAGRKTVMVGDGANDAELVRNVDYGIACQLVHTAPEILVESADCLVNSEEGLCTVLSRL